jgi:NADPH:quinone reductase-like Zn-dependent oxidoreductase
MNNDTVPTSMQALVADRSIASRLLNHALKISRGNGVQVTTVPVPSISDSEILVQVSSVALNPTDFKHIDVIAPRGSIIGCDYAGKVVKVGCNAPGNWKVRDRAAGWVHGGLFPDRGSFADYLKVPGDLAWKVPTDVSDEEASTYGVSAVTAMLALNTRLGVPWLDGAPEQGERDSPILIYAGSTAAGLYAIQIAKLAGLRVITTASPHSFDLVKKYGADAVFDYRSPTAIDEIIDAHPDINRAMDCFSEGKSTEFCAKVINKKGGKVITLLDPGTKSLFGAQIELILAYTAFNVSFQWLPPIGPSFAGSSSDREALARFYSSLQSVCTKLKPPPIKLIDGGLHNLTEGLDMLRKGQVSGTKLVAIFNPDKLP